VGNYHLTPITTDAYSEQAARAFEKGAWLLAKASSVGAVGIAQESRRLSDLDYLPLP